MSFRKNESQQFSSFDNSQNLTVKEQGVLKKSCAKTFAEGVLPNISENRFSVLYSDKASRPNTPINVIISALIFKELFTLSGDEMVEELILVPRFQYTLHTSNYGEQPISDKRLPLLTSKSCSVIVSLWVTMPIIRCVRQVANQSSRDVPHYDKKGGILNRKLYLYEIFKVHRPIKPVKVFVNSRF